MRRRSFIKLSLAAAAAALTAKAEDASSQARSPKGFKVGSGKDHYLEELLVMGGRFDCKVSARDTGGELCIYDTLRDSKGGPGLHLHHSQDEWFYVVRGEFIVRVGDETLSLGPGDSAFAPRRIPHAFAMTSEGEGQMLVLFQPAGSMEDFFLKMSRAGSGINAGQEAMKQLCRDHGMELLGPPLKL